MEAPTPVVVMHHQAVATQGGCCGVPAGVSCAVKATRGLSIAIIIIHVIALAAFGFFSPIQWAASLIGIIMGSVLLCQFSKCTYIAAGVLYIFGLALDAFQAILWMGFGAVVIAVIPLVGAVLFLIGSAFALTASCNWGKAMSGNNGSGVALATV